MSGKSVISLKKLPGMSDELFSYAEAFDRYGPFGPRYYVDELHLLECESYSFSGAINTADDSYRLYFSLYAHTLLVELYSSNEGGTVIWGQEYYLKDGKEYISVDEFMKCVNKAYAEAQEFIKDWEGVSVSSRKGNKMIKSKRYTARELTGKERMFLQICHNLWKWIKDGHGASSFFSTVQGKNALSDIEKISGKSGMQAENEVLALYDKVDNLAFRIDREKRLDHPEVKKAEFEFDSYMGDFNSTRLGKIIAEEIANDMGIRKASLAVRKGNWKYSNRTPVRRSVRRKASTEWWHGIEGAWYGGSKPMYGSWIFYWGVPIDSDDLWGNLREVYESECEYNGTEYTEEGFDEWLETDSGIDALETELQIIAEGEFLYYRDKVYDIYKRIMMDGGKADEDSSDIFDLITSSDKYRVPGSARFTKDVADSIGIKAEEEKAAFVEAVQDKSLKDVFDLKDILKWYLS